jgi:hypothetical protein
MQQQPTDAAGAPVIEHVSGKIATLERRAQHLGERLNGGRQGSAASAAFDRAELSAIEAAVRALKYHRAQVETLDEPILALSEIVQAHDEQEERIEDMIAGGDMQAALAEIRHPNARLMAAVHRARVVLREWEMRT